MEEQQLMKDIRQALTDIHAIAVVVAAGLGEMIVADDKAQDKIGVMQNIMREIIERK